MRYQVWFIAAALICLLSGIGVGFWFMTPMGGDLEMRPTHAHLNLFGWVTLSLYGLIHNAFPQLGKQRLAMVQFWFAVVGGVALPVGFAITRESPAHNAMVGAGSVSGAIGAILFTVMYCRSVIFVKSA